MKIGIELFAAEEIPVSLGSYVEISLYSGGESITRAKGHDDYHLAAVIPKGRRFAGSGRKYVCQLDLPGLGLGPMEARPAVSAALADDDWDLQDLTVSIKTNLVFTVPDFKRLVRVRAVADGRTWEPDTWHSPRPGLFLASLSIPHL